MSYETKVQVVRPSFVHHSGSREEDGPCTDLPRAVVIEGGPLPGDEVVHGLHGRCTVEAVEPRYTLRFPGGGAYHGSLARDLSPAPDPTEALRKRILRAMDLNPTYETMADNVMEILKAEGLLE